MPIELIIYLIEVFGSLKPGMGVFMMLSVFVFVVVCLNIFAFLMELSDQPEAEKTEKTRKTLTKTALILALLFVLFSAVIPSKQTMYTILGIHLAKQVISEEELGTELKKIPINALKSTNKALESFIGEYSVEVLKKPEDNKETK